MLDKFFVDPTLPDTIRSLQSRAQSRVYLDAACRGYAAGFVQEARADLQQAIELEPDLLSGHPPRALGTFASWALTPYVKDPNAFLDTLLSNLPDNAAIPRWSRRKARGLLHAVAAFECYRRQEHVAVSRHALLALLHDPVWGLNKGLVSIGLQSTAGTILNGWIRRLLHRLSKHSRYWKESICHDYPTAQ